MSRPSPFIVAGLFAGLAAALSACGDKGSNDSYGGSTKPGTPPAAPAAGAAKPDGGAAAASAGGYGYAAALGDELDRRTGDALKRGRAFLLRKRDEATGAWDPNGPVSAGYSAFGVLALIATTPKESVGGDPTIRRSLEFIRTKQKDDGSIWSNPQFVNYETAVCVAALAGARIAEFGASQAKARDFIANSQIQADEAALSYGGFPYQSKSDPTAPADLSNAQFSATALHEAGLPVDSPVWTRLTAYLAKVQNSSETNTTVVKRMDKDLKAEVEVVSGNDGGAGYGPGMSKSGLVKREDGKLRDALVRQHDVRARRSACCSRASRPTTPALVARRRLDLEVTSPSTAIPASRRPTDPAKNGQQGYYYYLLTMAARWPSTRRRRARRSSSPTPPARRTTGAARSRRSSSPSRRTDGSWLNPVDRWEEGNPLVVTSYAVQALADVSGTPAVATPAPPLRASALLVLLPAAAVASMRGLGGGGAEASFHAIVVGAFAGAVGVAFARPAAAGAMDRARSARRGRRVRPPSAPGARAPEAQRARRSALALGRRDARVGARDARARVALSGSGRRVSAR